LVPERDLGRVDLLPTAIDGCYLVRPHKLPDERGFFARVWDPQPFAALGLTTDIAQCSVAFNHARGTLRGLHYQAAPHDEAKLIRVTRGAAFDVLVDLRRDSASFRAVVSVELRIGALEALFCCEGVAHGYLTLEDATELHYQISTPYAPEAARGVRWNDPAFGIDWPSEPVVISERDRSYADWAP
jgi:dTDP-4-dehydrorhamnose 3,5-epimerase